MMNGSELNFGCLRISRQRRKPSMFGMRISEMTASMLCCSSTASASTPSQASRTVEPSASRFTRRTLRFVALSSTLRMFLWLSDGRWQISFARFVLVSRHLLEKMRQSAGVDRFDQVGVTAGLNRLRFFEPVGVGGHGHHVDLARDGVGLELAHQRQAVHAGQFEVQQNELWLVLLDRGYRPFRRFRVAHLVS